MVVNATAVEDTQRGVVVEAEVALWNLAFLGPPELVEDVSAAFRRIKAYREGRWVAKCDKCHSPIASHPGKRECDRVPGVYSMTPEEWRQVVRNLGVFALELLVAVGIIGSLFVCIWAFYAVT